MHRSEKITIRLAVLLLLLMSIPARADDEPLRIAVAANFRSTLEKINRRYESDTGGKISLSSASTGVLASQILHGAPYDLFFAADRETPHKLLELTPAKYDAPFCYAVGKLVLVGGGDLAALALADNSLAIANPATAPYGRAAMEVLSRKEFSAGGGRKLVRGNNVVQAYQFWHSGAADLALVPRALTPQTGIPIPASWHQTLEQHAMVLKPGPAVDAYLKWFRSDTVRSLITRAGYQPCP